MGVCLKCGYEYEAAVRLCPECQEELVAADDSRAQALRAGPQKMVSVYRSAQELFVRRICSALRTEGIAAMLHSFEMPWYDDMYKHPSGAWGEVLVLEKDEAKAREIIDVLETGSIVAEDMPEAEE